MCYAFCIVTSMSLMFVVAEFENIGWQELIENLVDRNKELFGSRNMLVKKLYLEYQ